MIIRLVIWGKDSKYSSKLNILITSNYTIKNKIKSKIWPKININNVEIIKQHLTSFVNLEREILSIYGGMISKNFDENGNIVRIMLCNEGSGSLVLLNHDNNELSNKIGWLCYIDLEKVEIYYHVKYRENMLKKRTIDEFIKNNAYTVLSDEMIKMHGETILLIRNILKITKENKENMVFMSIFGWDDNYNPSLSYDDNTVSYLIHNEYRHLNKSNLDKYLETA